jgi:nucleotide-binding universal stress UspA family protein
MALTPSPKRPVQPTVAEGTRAATVIVGLDGSDTSWDAFWWACGECRRVGGRIMALFVSSTAGSGVSVAAPDFAALGAFDFAFRDQSASERAKGLHELAKRHAADHGVDLAFLHVRGDTATELLRLAGEQHADQIVVGRSTKKRHHLAGSLGRRLVAKREAPIIVVVP